MSEYRNDSFPKLHAWAKGDVVRCFEGPFADATIVGFNNEGYARMVRPYAYATTTNGWLVGAETIDMVNLTRGGYTKVDIGRNT